jgi:hypothetical protein
METYQKLEIFAILRNSVEIFAILLEILKRDSMEIQKKNIRAAEYFAAKVANSINNTWQSKRDVNFTRKYGAVKYTKRYGMSETGCSKLFLCLWFQSFLAFFIFTFG